MIGHHLYVSEGKLNQTSPSVLIEIHFCPNSVVFHCVWHIDSIVIKYQNQYITCVNVGLEVLATMQWFPIGYLFSEMNKNRSLVAWLVTQLYLPACMYDTQVGE